MYFSHEVAERIKKRSKEKNIALKELLSICNLGSNTMANMKKSFISVESIAKIADVLDCSIDYLMGRTDIIEINKGE